MRLCSDTYYRVPKICIYESAELLITCPTTSRPRPQPESLGPVDRQTIFDHSTTSSSVLSYDYKFRPPNSDPDILDLWSALIYDNKNIFRLGSLEEPWSEGCRWEPVIKGGGGYPLLFISLCGGGGAALWEPCLMPLIVNTCLPSGYVRVTCSFPYICKHSIRI